MSLLKLSDIGKIYVSDSSVAVGIRNVNLEFELGEFVAVTGKSGCGKSTLLNIISGMDSYEEGEMYIEDEPTSHYTQADFEEYRKKYISFVFQDYNIVDSFTVLQNVELSLMHIQNSAERRKKALEFIKRVGLYDHRNHKGSKLSGGQKQRTVIARALAKDSPIILADEPTGNLDSKSSSEILSLLHEISKNKLVIVVTHNFDEIEPYATRQIRLFDGSVDFDQKLRDPELITDRTIHESPKINSFSGSVLLGFIKFRSMPKFSVFLSLLFTVALVGILLVTSSFKDSFVLFKDETMFNHEKGRLIVVKNDSSPMDEDEIKALAEKTGAESFLQFDYLLDMEENSYISNSFYTFNFSYGIDSDVDVGRLPENSSEALISCPIGLKPFFDSKFKGKLRLSEIIYRSDVFDDVYVVGINYYYDNTVDPTISFTKEGFNQISYKYYTNEQSSNEIYYSLDIKYSYKYPGMNESYSEGHSFAYIDVDKSLSENTISYKEVKNGWYFDEGFAEKYSLDYVDLWRYTYSYLSPADDRIVKENINISLDEKEDYRYDVLYVSEDIYNKVIGMFTGESYSQASLFFKNDKEAHKAVSEIKEDGYRGVPSDTTYEDSIEMLEKILLYGLLFVIWVLVIVFIAFLIYLCTNRSIGATKGDLGIMRSMGIKKNVIKYSIYFQLLFNLIPAIIITAAVCIVVFTNPRLNSMYSFLHASEYIITFVGMLFLIFRLSRKFTSKLFGTSVRKTLKGGDAE